MGGWGVAGPELLRQGNQVKHRFKVNRLESQLRLEWQRFALACMTALSMALLAPHALMAADTPIGNIFCTSSGWMTGNTGKAIATIAITIFGIGALLGKVSWGVAVVIALGVSLVYGAAAVVEAFGVPGVPTGCATTGSWR